MSTTKKLSLLTAIGAIALSATPASAETNTPAKLNFSCEINNGVPTTVVSAEGTATQNIFNWQGESLSNSNDPLALCKDVSAKLNQYYENENDFSVLAFKSYVQGGLPTICATKNPNVCEATLLTAPLSRTEEAEVVAKNVLEDIINPELHTVRTEENARGLQSITHSISLAELIFGRKFMK